MRNEFARGLKRVGGGWKFRCINCSVKRRDEIGPRGFLSLGDEAV